MKRKCTACSRRKPVEDFSKDARQHLGRAHVCKACANERHLKWVERNTAAADLAKRRYRLKPYGLTPEQFDELLEAQDGLCAICGAEEGLRSHHVDHDHRTGEVRGLLCTNCNQGIGRLKDDPDILIAAAMYLLKTSNMLAGVAESCQI